MFPVSIPLKPDDNKPGTTLKCCWTYWLITVSSWSPISIIGKLSRFLGTFTCWMVSFHGLPYIITSNRFSYLRVYFTANSSPKAWQEASNPSSNNKRKASPASVIHLTNNEACGCCVVLSSKDSERAWPYVEKMVPWLQCHPQAADPKDSPALYLWQYILHLTGGIALSRCSIKN